MWKRSWKAVTYDFAALQNYDDVDAISVCLTQREIAILKSSIIPAYWSTRWSNLTITSDQLNELVAEIDAKLDEVCIMSGIEDVRQNPDCKLQKLENSIWSDFADLTLCVSPTDGGNDYYIQQNINIIQSNLYLTMYIPGDPLSININTVVVTFDTDQSGNPDPDRQTALCMAAQAFVGSYCARKIQELDQKFLGVFLILAGIAIITGGIGIIAGMAVGGAALVGGWGYAVARAALADTAAQQDVACCMNDGLAGMAVNELNFANSLGSCGFTPGSNAAIVRDFVADSIGNQESYLTMLDALGRAYIQVTFGVDECNCVPMWTQVFDFAIDGYLGTWTAIDYGGVTGNYDAINGYWQGECNLWPSTNILIETNIAATEIIAIKATFDNVRTRDGSRTAFIKLDDVQVASYITYPNGIVIVEPSALPPTIATNFKIGMSTSCTSGCSGCFSHILKIEISGTGTNPF